MPQADVWRLGVLAAGGVLLLHAQTTNVLPLDFRPCCVVADGNGGSFVAGSRPLRSIVAAKIAPDGTVAWKLEVPAGPNDTPAAAAVDPGGRLWVATAPARFSGTNALLLQVAADGASVLMSRRIGGTTFGSSAIQSLAFDSAGDLYVGGATDQTDFPATPGVLIDHIPAGPIAPGVIAAGNPQMGFVAKFSPQLNLIYSTFLGGTQMELPACPGQCYSSGATSSVSGIAVDAGGAVTAAGITNASDFPVTHAAFQPSCRCQSGVPNAFVTRLNPQATGLVWSTFLGGSSGNTMTIGGLTLESNGGVLLTGTTSALDFPVSASALQPAIARPRSNTGAASNPRNGFISRISPDGAQLTESTFFGLLYTITAPHVDAGGRVWISGGVSDTNGLPLPADSLSLGNSLLAALSPDLSQVLFGELLPDGVAGQDLTVSEIATTLGAAGSIGFVSEIPAGPVAGPAILGVADSAAAAVTGSVAPGEFVSIYGTGLDGSAVLFDGAPAQTIYSSDRQLNVLAPYGLPVGKTVRVALTNGSAVPLQVVRAQPNIFVVLNEDGSVNSEGNPARAGADIFLLLSGAGAPANAESAEVDFTYTYFVPLSNIEFQQLTLDPRVVGDPNNLLRLAVQPPAPPVSGAGGSITVQIGGANSPAIPVYIR